MFANYGKGTEKIPILPHIHDPLTLLNIKQLEVITEANENNP